ncbi:MAG: MG2 domain-containing protein, partial [Thermoplasmata archaeon]
MRARRRKRTLEFVAFVMVAVVLASCVAALNADQAYLAGRSNLTIYVPDRLYTDIPTTLLVLTTTSDGTPVADQEITIDLITSSKVQQLYAGRTGPDGIALPPLIAPQGEEEGRLVITSGGDVVARTVQLASSVRTFLSTDKPIYQPGQTVHIRTLTFEGEASAVSTRDVTLSVISPDCDRIFRKVLQPNDFGIASFDYPLGYILPLGVYRLEADVGGSTVSTAFGVQHYVLPKFQISFSGIRGWYAVGEQVGGEILAEYFFGKPVHGQVSMHLFYVEEEYEPVGSTSQLIVDGRTLFSIGPNWDSIPDEPKGYFELNATVVDQAGQTETKTVRLPVSRYPILLSVVEDSNVYGARSTYYVVARYPDGTPVADADVSYAPPGYSPMRTKTDERGIASMSFDFKQDGTMRVTVSKDSESSWVRLYQSGGEGVKVVSDKSSYDVGNIAEFDIFHEGPSSTPWAYFEVSSRGFVISTGRVELQSGRGSFTLPVRQDMVPQVRVKVHKVGADLHIFEDVLILPVGTLSDLDIA